MVVHVARADIWTLPVDAVVSPGNSMGIMGSGISGQIKRHGGDVIQQAAMALAPIAIGAAVVTTAGQLPCKHVLHVPTMEEPGMKIGAESVPRAARASLIAADLSCFKGSAIPSICTDLGDGPVEEAVRAIGEERRAHKRPNPETVYVVDPQNSVIAAFEEALRNAQQNI